MKYNLDYEKGITNRGNLFRIKEVMKRAAAGEKLTIGFLGGSITQGCLASAAELCYAYRVFLWWKKQFPKAEFTYVNAGIGGTDSQFGVARADADLLSKLPDFVIVEFSVNDRSTSHYMETYEGLIRKIYTSQTKPAIMLVHNVYYDNGASAQRVHSRIGRYYELPSVSMQSTIYQAILQGEIQNSEISEDDLHPNDEGHRMVASVINYYLDRILDEIDCPEVPELELKEPLTYNGYQNSIRFDQRNICPELHGFAADEEKQTDITDCFKNGWRGTKKGDFIRFTVEGSSIAVQYRKTIQKPAPIAHVILDEDEKNPFVLDANFQENWGDKLALDTVMEHGKNEKHTIEIRIAEVPGQTRCCFDLISIIVSGSSTKNKFPIC